MIIKPKVRDFICTTAHPAGCAAHVQQWIDYVKKQPLLTHAPKKVLIIGASTGFGLAARIALAFGGQAQTIGVFFERPALGKRTASAGWYNTAAFERAAKSAGIYAKSVNGDAFSDEIKNQVSQLITEDWHGEVDLVIYSIASPRRVHPHTHQKFTSVLKPIGQSFVNKSVNVMNGEVIEVSIEPATDEEIAQTVAVMGGEDWQMWMDHLQSRKLLAQGVKTVAFTYIGPALTHAIYRNGTIGKAKAHLEATAVDLCKKLSAIDGQALISVNKALVTQASAAIPVVPLYISLLYKVMKKKQIHEGCIEQMWRLFAEKLYGRQSQDLDDAGRLRIDDWEMRDDVQQEVKRLWAEVNTGNLETISDLQGYRDDFYHLFGFGFESVNYEAAVGTEVFIDSISDNF